jgi:hypothetical protein
MGTTTDHGGMRVQTNNCSSRATFITVVTTVTVTDRPANHLSYQVSYIAWYR